MEEINAKGTKGFILYSPFGGKERYFFRVYEKDETFKDYDLKCEELEVTIGSDFYSLYDSEGKKFLDFSSEVLGLDGKHFS
jgi:hypothetical protein